MMFVYQGIYQKYCLKKKKYIINEVSGSGVSLYKYIFIMG